MSQNLYIEGQDYTQTSLADIRNILRSRAPLLTFAFQQETPGDQIITIESPEFTCICPFSDYPDFGVVKINYTPTDRCIELKSFKLFINAFRDLKIFHEGVTEVILAEFIAVVQPKWAEITVEMNPRGNVTTICKKQYNNKPQEVFGYGKEEDIQF